MNCARHMHLYENRFFNCKTRTSTQGLELEMVFDFLARSPFVTNYSCQKREMAILLEPNFASGYPDALLIQYDSSKFMEWSAERERLKQNDLKLFAYVLGHRPSKKETISNRLGIDLGETEASLKTLAACNFVEQDGNKWCSRKKDDFFGIKSIVAIEAKIGNVKDALHQALYNKLFSTESYILINSKVASENTLENCKKFGIGIFANGGYSLQLKAPREKMTINYMSLQINEWLSSSVNKGVSCGLSF